MRLAINSLLEKGGLKTDAITDHVAAVSCGIYAGQPVLDLDYQEDSDAGTDANFVLTGAGNLIEVQASAEGAPFSRSELDALITLAEKGVSSLISSQKNAVTIND